MLPRWVAAKLSERAAQRRWKAFETARAAGKSEEAYRLCLRRTLSTATHETGHILTMQHCTAFRCLMNGCNTHEERDRTPLHPCPVCLRKLCWNLRVEAVLAQHPDVAKAAVIGLPHPRWSEAVTAVVVLRDGAKVSEDDLVKHCRASLAGYETPKSVVFVTDLPETVGGKVLKYKLRAEHTAHYAELDASS